MSTRCRTAHIHTIDTAMGRRQGGGGAAGGGDGDEVGVVEPVATRAHRHRHKHGHRHGHHAHHTKQLSEHHPHKQRHRHHKRGSGQKEAAGGDGEASQPTALDPLLSDLALDAPFPRKGKNWWSEAAATFSALQLPRRTRETRPEESHWSWRRVASGVGNRSEDETELYPLCGTSVFDIGRHFGAASGLYFRQLQLLALTAAVWGLISLVTSFHEFQSGMNQAVWNRVLYGTMACTITGPVLAVDAEAIETGYDCPFVQIQGITDLAGSAAMVLAAFIIAVVTRWQAAGMKAAVPTAQGSSVVVTNPTPTADDPREWHRLFAGFGPIAYITIARADGPLLSLLAQRRALAWKLRARGEPVPERAIRAMCGAAGDGGNGADGTTPRLSWKAASLVRKLLGTTRRVETMLAASPAPVKSVYITFENEASQREALSADHSLNGLKALRVRQAGEPSDIIWENLHIPLWKRVARMAVATLASAIIAGGAFWGLAYLIARHSLIGGAAVAVVSRALAPVLRVVSGFERHVNLRHKQTARMVRLLAARLLVTTGVLLAGVNWQDWLNENEITRVAAVLLADAIINPILRLTAIIARRGPGAFFGVACARTREEAAAAITTVRWDLGERYTDAVKTIVLAFTFQAFTPTGAFVAAGALLVSFFTDRHLLLRAWQTPRYDAGPSLALRLHDGVLLGVVSHMAVTAVAYGCWPFAAVARDMSGNSSDGTGTGAGAWFVSNVSPSWQFWSMKEQFWMGTDQLFFLRLYALASIVAAGAWAGLLLIQYSYLLLCSGRRRKTPPVVMGEPNSNVAVTAFTTAYVPTFIGAAATAGSGAMYVASGIAGVHLTHMPKLVAAVGASAAPAAHIGGVNGRNLALDVPQRFHRSHISTITAPHRFVSLGGDDDEGVAHKMPVSSDDGDISSLSADEGSDGSHTDIASDGVPSPATATSPAGDDAHDSNINVNVAALAAHRGAAAAAGGHHHHSRTQSRGAGLLLAAAAATRDAPPAEEERGESDGEGDGVEISEADAHVDVDVDAEECPAEETAVGGSDAAAAAAAPSAPEPEPRDSVHESVTHSDEDWEPVIPTPAVLEPLPPPPIQTHNHDDDDWEPVKLPPPPSPDGIRSSINVGSPLSASRSSIQVAPPPAIVPPQAIAAMAARPPPTPSSDSVPPPPPARLSSTVAPRQSPAAAAFAPQTRQSPTAAAFAPQPSQSLAATMPNRPPSPPSAVAAGAPRAPSVKQPQPSLAATAPSRPLSPPIYAASSSPQAAASPPSLARSPSAKLYAPKPQSLAATMPARPASPPAAAAAAAGTGAQPSSRPGSPLSKTASFTASLSASARGALQGMTRTRSAARQRIGIAQDEDSDSGFEEEEAAPGAMPAVAEEAGQRHQHRRAASQRSNDASVDSDAFSDERHKRRQNALQRINSAQVRAKLPPPQSPTSERPQSERTRKTSLPPASPPPAGAIGSAGHHHEHHGHHGHHGDHHGEHHSGHRHHTGHHHHHHGGDHHHHGGGHEEESDARRRSSTAMPDFESLPRGRSQSPDSSKRQG